MTVKNKFLYFGVLRASPGIFLGTAVGIGGFIWCMLYFKMGRLWAPWLSHILADLGIMLAGYHIIY